MKKITGKALSLVLSLALVASSFSTFASASRKTVSGTVDLQEDDAKVLYLVNGGKDSQQERVDLTDWISTQQGSGDSTTMETVDHEEASDINIVDVSHVSGDKLVKWGDEDGRSIDEDENENCFLFLKSNKNDGKEVLSVLYKGTYTNDDGDDVRVKARQEITVYVADYGTVYIGKAYDSNVKLTGDPAAKDNRVGKDIEEIDSLAQKSDAVMTQLIDGKNFVDSTTVSVYYAVPSPNSCLANYELQSFNLDEDEKEDIVSRTTNPEQKDAGFTLKLTGDTSKLKYAIDPATNVLTMYALDDCKSGNITIKATHDEDDNKGLDQDVDNDKVTVKTRIDKKVKVTTGDYVNIDKDKKTYLYQTGHAIGDCVELSGEDNFKEITDSNGKKGGRINVTGYDLDLDLPASSAFTIDDKSASVGKITGKINGTVKVKTGNVSSIDMDAADVEVGEDGKVGDIDIGTDSGYSNAKADLTTEGTVGDISADGDVTVRSGSTGDIDTDGTIEIDANDDDNATHVGAITTKGETTIDSEDSKVVVGSFKATDDGAKLTLKGDSISVGKVDFDYRDDTTLSFDDFQGKIDAPVNATKATIETTDEDDDVVITGEAKIDTLDVTDDSTIVFEKSLKAEYVTGSGELKLPIGSLYISDGVSGSPILKFTNDFKVGDTAFKCDSDAVDVDDFDCFGFTLKKSEGKETDTLKIESAKFAGLVITPGSARIAKGAQWAQTFKAAAYPSGTSLPSGDKIDWDFEGNENYFKYTENADGTATLEVIGLDPDFESENTATLTATLVDEDGDEDSDYEATDCDVTALAVPDRTFISDTGAKLNIQKGKTYQFKITSLDGKEPTFGVGSGSLSVTKVGKSGNDYFFKITAVGKVGDSVGVYVNGKRSTIATITAGSSSIKVDTGAKVKVAKGKTYQFKVTASSKPTFASGNGSVFTTAASGQKGNDYFFKITAVGKSGDSAGIYINGVRHTIATIA